MTPSPLGSPAADAPSPLQMVDLHAQVAALRPELDAAIAAVLDSGAFVRGPFVAAFERELAAYVAGLHGEPGSGSEREAGSETAPEVFALGVGNGTDALQIALMALGVGPGDEVVTPAFTFIATAEAAALLGARPVFADIDPATFNLDPAAVEAALTPRTRAIVPVHLFGQAAGMDALRAVADRHGLPLVEDAAQAIGGTYRGRPVGTLGAVAALSFYPSKNLGAYGDGGALLTTDAALFGELRAIANHGAERKYYHRRVGVNSRLDALHAAILSVKLRHLPAWTAARRCAAAVYDALLAGLDGIATPPRDADAHHVFHQYTLRVAGGRRDALAAHLRDRGIPTMVYYPEPLHRLPVFADLGVPEGALPETERACREVLSLPMHPDLTLAQLRRVAGAVRDFVGAASASPVALEATP